MSVVALAARGTSQFTWTGTVGIFVIFAGAMLPGAMFAALAGRRRWLLLAAGAVFLLVPATGWGDGALRLFPPADLHLFGHLIPSQFWPGVLLPGLSFALLYLWPFLDARLTRDRADHQLLDRPRDHPVRLGIGVGALTFYALLLVAGGSDLLARWADLPITGVVMALRFVVLGVPVLVGLVGWLLARALRHSDATALGGLSRADVRAALRRRTALRPADGETVSAGTRPAPERSAAEQGVRETESEIAPEVRTS